MADEERMCGGCDRPYPRQWCWEGRIECWADKPPRYLSTEDVWRWFRGLEEELTNLHAAYEELYRKVYENSDD